MGFQRINISDDEVNRLLRVAEQTSSRPKHGRFAYQPCWRTLVRRIASGEVVVVELNPDPRVLELEKAIAINNIAAAAGASQLGGGREEERQKAFTQLPLVEA